MNLFIQDLVRQSLLSMDGNVDSDGSTISTNNSITMKAQHPLRAIFRSSPRHQRLVLVCDNARVFANARPKEISYSVSPPTIADRRKLQASNRWGADCSSIKSAPYSLDCFPSNSNASLPTSRNSSGRTPIRRYMSDSSLTVPKRSWKEPHQTSTANHQLPHPPMRKPRSPRASPKMLKKHRIMSCNNLDDAVEREISRKEKATRSFSSSSSNVSFASSSFSSSARHSSSEDLLEAASAVVKASTRANECSKRQFRISKTDSMELTASAIAMAQQRHYGRACSSSSSASGSSSGACGNSSWNSTGLPLPTSPSKNKLPPKSLSSGSNHGSSNKLQRISSKTLKASSTNGGRSRMRRQLSTTYKLGSGNKTMELLQKALGDMAPTRKNKTEQPSLESTLVSSRW